MTVAFAPAPVAMVMRTEVVAWFCIPGKQMSVTPTMEHRGSWRCYGLLFEQCLKTAFDL